MDQGSEPTFTLFTLLMNVGARRTWIPGTKCRHTNGNNEILQASSSHYQYSFAFLVNIATYTSQNFTQINKLKFTHTIKNKKFWEQLIAYFP
jgi:hypothetical protein